MRLPNTIVTVFVSSLLVGGILVAADDQAKDKNSTRTIRQTNADQMVQNILRWLQGVYSQQSRRSRFAYEDELTFDMLPNNGFASDRIDYDAFRQGTLREYLPPTHPEKPRPFAPRPSGNGIDEEGNFVDGGYPPAGSVTPQPPFNLYTNPVTGGITGYLPVDANGYPSENGGTSTLPPPSLPTKYPETIPPYRPGFPTAPPQGFPERAGFQTTQPPEVTERQSYPTPSFPTHPPVTDYSEKPGYSTQPPGLADRSGIPTTEQSGQTEGPRPTYPSGPSTIIVSEGPGVTSERPGYPTQPPTGPSETSEFPGFPTHQAPSESTGFPTRQPGDTTPGELYTSIPVTSPTKTPSDTPSKPEDLPSRFNARHEEPPRVPTEEDLKHPPHIHAIDVQCAKETMTIDIEFNRQFDGVIYSKGYYHMPECIYVKENSGQTKYSFTLNLNMCGTEFINAFDTERQSYLENVLVIQNEAGIQEVWDTIRAVRCLWEGNLKEQLSVSLMVGMLTQEIVTFSGDTAVAKLDIVLGRGPFGQPVSGLVKIGEPMTLVVSVSGDAGFDVQVKDCKAVDTTVTNTVQLTDDEGCVLKPKLFGAFQKTRNTENTGASIIAYAYFNAFKFPDVMDLMIECNIELCKTDCNICPNPDQPLEPAKRRKRDLNNFNETIHDGVMMGKHLRVVLPEELVGAQIVNDAFCMSTLNFVFSSLLLISLLTASSLLCVRMWFKMHRLQLKH